MAKTKRKRDGFKKKRSTIRKKSTTTRQRIKPIKTGGTLVNFDNNFPKDVIIDTLTFPVKFGKLKLLHKDKRDGTLTRFFRCYVIQFHALKHLDTFDDFPNDFYTLEDTPDNRIDLFKRVCDFAEALVLNALEPTIVQSQEFNQTNTDRGYNIVAFDTKNKPYTVTYNINKHITKPTVIPQIITSIYGRAENYLKKLNNELNSYTNIIEVFSISRISNKLQSKSFLYNVNDVPRKLGESFQPHDPALLGNALSANTMAVGPSLSATSDEVVQGPASATSDEVLPNIKKSATKAIEEAEAAKKLAEEAEANKKLVEEAEANKKLAEEADAAKKLVEEAEAAKKIPAAWYNPFGYFSGGRKSRKNNKKNCKNLNYYTRRLYI